ncbi:MAG: hypothetical protein KKA73_08255 [Chloroflexi bacterium]|nr:hypothetical protein [Chloroflexota bacterium]MBU1747667.1 hypothetical protein [Chloroflexota bacterium]
MRQFLRATTAHIDEDEHAQVASTLSPAQAELFYRQDLSDQRHALDVYQTLRAGGHDDLDLLQAALLHDVGKSVGPTRIPLPYRVVIVLVRAVRPTWLERLARPDPASWRYPFYVHNQHPARGAELTVAAQSSAQVMHLVAVHHAPGDDPLARALCQADEAN